MTRGGILLVKQRLALQVGPFHNVSIDQPQLADPGSGQNLRRHGSQRTTSQHGNFATLDLPLPFGSNGCKLDLPRVSVGLRGIIHPSILNTSPQTGKPPITRGV